MVFVWPRLSPLIMVCAALVALLAWGVAGTVAAAPMTTTVPAGVAGTPAAERPTTLIVTRGRTRWRARETFVFTRPNVWADEVVVSRWNGEDWVRQGIVRLPTGGTLGPLRTARLTHSAAPDFVVSVGGGADWTPFTVVSRLLGKWQTVPFDYPLNRLVIDAWVIRGDLVQSKMDACGCAAGPETYTWYRFNGRIFVPTAPNGPGPGCTAASLDAAHPLLGLPANVGPPGRLSAHFPVAKFVCLDGWALARDANGRFALFDQQSEVWFRSSVGSLTRIGSYAHGFALPRSLLAQLEQSLASR